MMNHRILLGSIVAVVILLSGAFFFLNGGQSEEQNITDTSESNSVTPAASLDEASVPEVTTTEPDVADIEEANEPEEAAEIVVTPSPTPTPTPTPTPAPIPTPASSGYTLAQVSQHNGEESCWTIVGDSVYDVTSYVTRHPGGKSKILRICGTDGTSEFEGQHGGDSKPENTLAKYRLGAYSN